jgi:peptide/nickel transport system permease protein
MRQREFWARLKRNRMAMAGLALVLGLFVVSIFAPWLAPYDPNLINLKLVLMPPSPDHYLGTDMLGRDVLSRIIYGSRVSLKVGFVAVGRGLVDLMLCFPAFFLILAVIAVLEPSIWNIMAVIGLTSWMGVARLVRAEFLSLREREFVTAARALGASDARLIMRHILPNALAPVMVSATLGVAGAILTESALSFLGLGVQPPTPSWGNILTAGKDNIEIAWWLSVFPGLAILVTVMSYNLLGEGIREAIDPRLKE